MKNYTVVNKHLELHVTLSRISGLLIRLRLWEISGILSIGRGHFKMKVSRFKNTIEDN